MAVNVVRQRYPNVMNIIDTANMTGESVVSLPVTATSATGARAGRAHAPTTVDAEAATTTTGAGNKPVGRQTVRALLTVIEQVWTSLLRFTTSCDTDYRHVRMPSTQMWARHWRMCGVRRTPS